MIKYFEMKNLKKCCLRVNEFGSLERGKPDKIIREAVPSNSTQRMNKIQVAIEVSLPNHNSNFALIGFEYLPSDQIQDTTNIAVWISKELREVPHNTLAHLGDKAYIGISEEYGQTVLDSAVETLSEMGGYASGEIVFNIGAHSQVGSSKFIFSKAVNALLKLSLLDLLNMTDLSIHNEIESMI